MEKRLLFPLCVSLLAFLPSCGEQKPQEPEEIEVVEEIETVVAPEAAPEVAPKAAPEVMPTKPAPKKEAAPAHAYELGKDINQAELEQKKQGNLVIDFYAPWCGPCKGLKPVIDALAKEYGDKVAFVKIDIDQHKGLAGGIRSIPTLHLYQNGQKVQQAIGGKTKDELRSIINDAFGL